MWGNLAGACCVIGGKGDGLAAGDDALKSREGLPTPLRAGEPFSSLVMSLPGLRA